MNLDTFIRHGTDFATFIIVAGLAVMLLLALLRRGHVTFAQYASEPPDLSVVLPWGVMVRPGVVLNKNGAFQACFEYRGPDLDSATKEELIITVAQLNNSVKRNGSGWYFYADMHHQGSPSFTQSAFPNPASQLIEMERAAQFEDGRFFESHYFFTVGWLPPKAIESKARDFFFEDEEITAKGEAQELAIANEWLDKFCNEADRIAGGLTRVLPSVRFIRDDDTLTYLHSTCSTKKHTVALPEIPTELDCLLTDVPLTGGRHPKLGESYIGAITVKGYPGGMTPGYLDVLNQQNFPFRYVVRWVALDKKDAQAEITKVRKEWFSSRLGLKAMFRQSMSPESAGNTLENPDALDKTADANAALQELGNDYCSYGYLTQTIIVLDPDFKNLKNRLQALSDEIEARGFVTINETLHGNALDAFLGCIPGNVINNIRRPMMNTLNLGHVMPVSSVWAGPTYCPNPLMAPKSPPHFVGATNGHIPFRFSGFIGDVGHMFIGGPTGAGKSVLLNFLESQWQRYSDLAKGVISQVYIFDKGGSSRVLTGNVGGTFYDLGSENSPAFQPLARVDDIEERRWAEGWILDRIAEEIGDPQQITSDMKTAVWNALTTLGGFADVRQRTITGFVTQVQDQRVKDALRRFCISGPFGAIVDSDHDDFEASPWIAFEMDTLMNTPGVVMAVLSYLFHRLEQQFDGVTPTFLVLDEAWIFLDHPIFAAKIREWLKTLRKKLVSVVFATQSLDEVIKSPIMATIKEQCLTKIYLPNVNAMNDETYDNYRSFGLNKKQIQIIATATPKEQYYLTSPEGNRLFSLGLGPVAIALVASTSEKSQASYEAVYEKHKGNVLDLNVAWLQTCRDNLPPDREHDWKRESLQWGINYVDGVRSALLQRAA
ncbi:DUF853 domain-containing protein (plasmid) [Dyella sp. BiH032]|uniref:TraG/VirB4 family ATPase n=1 Tax=Dyella sp. BiH032 TaxID=3075430 RepID=UPI002892B6FA|nr:DUF853 domain-containing protein [Dyella sp. BiH032]WNL48568.1 DUF853 domain-containing protein [Dyella sp. BiH032]